MVGRLGELGDAVDERDRRGEVRELQLATIDEPSPLRQPPISVSRCSISASVRTAISTAEITAAALRVQSHGRLMRIVSLVPHATELLFALGAGDEVVAVTHECDHPPAALELPRVTRDVLPAGLGAARDRRAVRERTLEGEAIYELDRDALAALEPELIVTQALCPVCAVSYEEVAELAQRLPASPRVIALDPKTLGETLGDVRTVAAGHRAPRTGAPSCSKTPKRASTRVVEAVRMPAAAPRPRVAALEWLDPVYRGRPLDAAADRAGRAARTCSAWPASHRRSSTWEAVAAAEPEVVVVMPCGYDAPRAQAEAEAHVGELARRSGPRGSWRWTPRPTSRARARG